MKKSVTLFLVLFVVVLFAACAEDNTEENLSVISFDVGANSYTFAQGITGEINYHDLDPNFPDVLTTFNGNPFGQIIDLSSDTEFLGLASQGSLPISNVLYGAEINNYFFIFHTITNNPPLISENIDYTKLSISFGIDSIGSKSDFDILSGCYRFSNGNPEIGGYYEGTFHFVCSNKTTSAISVFTNGVFKLKRANNNTLPVG